MVETVREHCPHKDCKYRGSINGVPWCMYLFVTGNVRKCDISKCDKYEKGKLRITSTLGNYELRYDDI